MCTSTILSKHHNSFYSAYSFSVANDTRGFISISQLDQRFFSHNIPYEYSPFRVILVKKKFNGESMYVNAGFSYRNKSLDVEVNLTAGTYHVYCIGSWIDKIYDYNLTVSSYQCVELNKIHCHNFPNIIS